MASTVGYGGGVDGGASWVPRLEMATFLSADTHVLSSRSSLIVGYTSVPK